MGQSVRLSRVGLMIAFLTVFASPTFAQSAALELRVTVTGPGFNRWKPYPGHGEFSWPGNIVRLRDGSLALVHSAGYYHASFASPRLLEPELKQRYRASGWPVDFEAPTGGRCMITRSPDNGRTWSRPETLLDYYLDDAPHGFFRSQDGALLCFVNVQASWYGFPEAPAPFKKDIRGLNTQQCVIRSTDDGRTWSEPVWLQGAGDFYERSHAQAIQLPDGTILFPTYYMNKGSTKLHGAIYASRDSGRSWGLWSKISREGDNSSDSASAASGNVDEPAIARLPSGRLFLICRPDGAYFYSTDRGRTWREQGHLVEKGVFKAPRAFVLSDGTIVSVCTYRNLQVFIGRDEGAEWSGPLDLDTTCYGYPGGILLDDESMLVSYNSSGRAPNSIYVLRFRLNGERNAIQLLPVGE